MGPKCPQVPSRPYGPMGQVPSSAFKALWAKCPQVPSRPYGPMGPSALKCLQGPMGPKCPLSAFLSAL